MFYTHTHAHTAHRQTTQRAHQQAYYNDDTIKLWHNLSHPAAGAQDPQQTHDGRQAAVAVALVGESTGRISTKLKSG